MIKGTGQKIVKGPKRMVDNSSGYKVHESRKICCDRSLI